MPHRQRRQLARRVAIELDENEIRQLDETRASLDIDRAFFGSIRVTTPVASGLAAIDMNLRARAAWPGLAHLPEIVLRAAAQNSFARQKSQIEPGLFCFVVVLIDRRPKSFGVDAPDFGDQLPVKFDRLALVVVAERPIAEHLEERVMVRIAADRFEIVVLAGNPQALLAISNARPRRLAYTQEKTLERDHPGMGKKQRRVALGHQRSRGDNLMAAFPEKVEKRLTDVVCSPAHVGFILTQTPAAVHPVGASPGLTGVFGILQIGRVAK